MLLEKQVQEECGECLKCFVDLFDSYISENDKEKLESIEEEIIQSLDYIKKNKNPKVYSAFNHVFSGEVMVKGRADNVKERYIKLEMKKYEDLKVKTNTQ